jgi:hypothetical protein
MRCGICLELYIPGKRCGIPDVLHAYYFNADANDFIFVGHGQQCEKEFVKKYGDRLYNIYYIRNDRLYFKGVLIHPSSNDLNA